MADPKTSTRCSAPADHGREHPDFGPMACGAVACAPHPDPERSYREPLCLRHLAAVVADWCTRCAFMQRSDEHAVCPTHNPRWVPPARPTPSWTHDLSSRLWPTRAW